MALHGGDRFGDEEFVRPEVGTAREVERHDGGLVAETTFEGVVAPTVLMDVGPLLDHRAPADEGTDEEHDGDGHAGRVHLLEIPEGALFGLGQHQHEDRRKHRFPRQSAAGRAST